MDGWMNDAWRRHFQIGWMNGWMNDAWTRHFQIGWMDGAWTYV
jgi:hypothetical protein